MSKASSEMLFWVSAADLQPKGPGFKPPLCSFPATYPHHVHMTTPHPMPGRHEGNLGGPRPGVSGNLPRQGWILTAREAPRSPVSGKSKIG